MGGEADVLSGGAPAAAAPCDAGDAHGIVVRGRADSSGRRTHSRDVWEACRDRLVGTRYGVHQIGNTTTRMLHVPYGCSNGDLLHAWGVGSRALAVEHLMCGREEVRTRRGGDVFEVSCRRRTDDEFRAPFPPSLARRGAHGVLRRMRPSGLDMREDGGAPSSEGSAHEAGGGDDVRNANRIDGARTTPGDHGEEGNGNDSSASRPRLKPGRCGGWNIIPHPALPSSPLLAHAVVCAATSGASTTPVYPLARVLTVRARPAPASPYA